MKKVISSEKIPVKLWLDDIEEGALAQAKNLANLPFAFKHIAIMPDAHQGYGMPIGGVMATKGVVVPNAVGVDIGCGMCAVKTSLTELDTDTLKKIMGEIRKVIPVGFAKHQQQQDEDLMPQGVAQLASVPALEAGGRRFESCHPDHIIPKEYNNALKSLGTLGGGNHFIEIQKGSDGFIWIMIHSGSRNLGFKVAKHYNKVAQDLNEKWYSNVPEFKGEDGLAFLPLDTQEGKDYLMEMNYCVDFALANRKLMMDRVTLAISKELDHNVVFQPMINIAHNYAMMENHFGQNVMVHRKGATLARVGTVGIIPGSQGTKSYIVTGKGNRESFESCSHGAGRKMGRKQAQRTLSLEEEQKKLEGIVHSVRTEKDLDEAPGSYKDISVVMGNQEDLVDISVELTPLGVIKG